MLDYGDWREVESKKSLKGDRNAWLTFSIRSIWRGYSRQQEAIGGMKAVHGLRSSLFHTVPPNADHVTPRLRCRLYGLSPVRSRLKAVGIILLRYKSKSFAFTDDVEVRSAATSLGSVAGMRLY